MPEFLLLMGVLYCFCPGSENIVPIVGDGGLTNSCCSVCRSCHHIQAWLISQPGLTAFIILPATGMLPALHHMPGSMEDGRFCLPPPHCPIPDFTLTTACSAIPVRLLNMGVLMLFYLSQTPPSPLAACAADIPACGILQVSLPSHYPLCMPTWPALSPHPSAHLPACVVMCVEGKMPATCCLPARITCLLQMLYICRKYSLFSQQPYTLPLLLQDQKTINSCLPFMLP